jgi:transglutaminase-like putative cysteine protease
MYGFPGIGLPRHRHQVPGVLRKLSSMTMKIRGYTARLALDVPRAKVADDFLGNYRKLLGNCGMKKKAGTVWERSYTLEVKKWRAWRWVVVVCTVSMGAWALSENATLHEFVPPDPKEDIDLGTTTLAGDFPAAIDTPSGLIVAPDTNRTPTANEKAYTSTTTPQNSLYYPDRDTRRPGAVEYEDPFSPAVTPFKRGSAFNTVRADFTMAVADPELKPMAVGGEVGPDEEAFYGDMTVDLAEGEATRIPSVAPGARVLRVHTVPDTEVTLYRDGAENWFIRGKQRARIRLLLQLAAHRQAFGGQVHNAYWNSLKEAPELPPNVKAAADQVNSKLIGVSRVQSFRDVINQLVTYYRSFAESQKPLDAQENVFLDIAQSKKGVCRHRAFAFVISALALGIPARMVTNEAHAWVEVHDGIRFRRIDLGGAAMDFHEPQKENRVPHMPPKDPFGWPPNSHPAEDGARASRQRNQANSPGGNQPGTSSSANPPGNSGRDPSNGLDPNVPANKDDRPLSKIVVNGSEREVFRNQALHLKGHVEADSERCGNVRVDVLLLLSNTTREIQLGSLATNAQGDFDGAVVVPFTISVGQYNLVLATPGTDRCGPGRSD